MKPICIYTLQKLYEDKQQVKTLKEANINTLRLYYLSKRLEAFKLFVQKIRTEFRWRKNLKEKTKGEVEVSIINSYLPKVIKAVRNGESSIEFDIPYYSDPYYVPWYLNSCEVKEREKEMAMLVPTVIKATRSVLGKMGYSTSFYTKEGWDFNNRPFKRYKVRVSGWANPILIFFSFIGRLRKEICFT